MKEVLSDTQTALCHLALDYLLAVKPVYAIPYIFLPFNEVINAIKGYGSINVRKYVA